MARFLTIGTQFFDNSGRPLSGGLLNFYESGSTTRKDTYSDADQTIPNENPVELDAYGRPPPIFFNGAARAVLTTSTGVVLDTLDPVGPSITRDAFAAWNSQLTYDENDIVQGSNSRYYQSIANDNIDHDPTSTSGYWQEVRFIAQWTTGYTYQAGALVVASDGYVYQGLTADNVGNDPTSSPDDWQLVIIDQSNVNISGGAINGTPIGGTTPAAGAFTTLEADSLAGTAVQQSSTDVTAGRVALAEHVGLKGVANTWSAAQTVLSHVIVQNASPQLRLIESDQAADGQLWRVLSNAGLFIIGATNDIITQERYAFQAQRSGATITGISLGNSTDDPDVTAYGNVVLGTGGKALDLATNGAHLKRSFTDAVIAGTTLTQAGATGLTTGFNRVATAGVSNAGVRLPTAEPGLEISVVNNGANQIQIWPATGNQIHGAALNNVDPTPLAVGSARTYVAVSSTIWRILR